MAENQTMELYKSWLPAQYETTNEKAILEDSIETKNHMVGTVNGKTFLEYLRKTCVLVDIPNISISADGITSLNVDPAHVCMNQTVLSRSQFFQYCIDGNIYQFSIDAKPLINYLKSINAKELKTLFIELTISETIQTTFDRSTDTLSAVSKIDHITISSDKGIFKTKTDEYLKFRVPTLNYDSPTGKTFKTDGKALLSWLKMVQKHTDHFQIVDNAGAYAIVKNDDVEFTLMLNQYDGSPSNIRVYLPLDFVISGLAKIEGEISISAASDFPVKFCMDQDNWLIVAPRIEND